MSKPRKSSSWLIALKQFNQDKGTWCLPRRGSKEYDEVKAIQERINQKQPEKKILNTPKEDPNPFIEKLNNYKSKLEELERNITEENRKEFVDTFNAYLADLKKDVGKSKDGLLLISKELEDVGRTARIQASKIRGTQQAKKIVNSKHTPKEEKNYTLKPFNLSVFDLESDDLKKFRKYKNVRIADIPLEEIKNYYSKWKDMDPIQQKIDILMMAVDPDKYRYNSIASKINDSFEKDVHEIYACVSGIDKMLDKQAYKISLLEKKKEKKLLITPKMIHEIVNSLEGINGLMKLNDTFKGVSRKKSVNSCPLFKEKVSIPVMNYYIAVLTNRLHDVAIYADELMMKNRDKNKDIKPPEIVDKLSSDPILKEKPTEKNMTQNIEILFLRLATTINPYLKYLQALKGTHTNKDIKVLFDIVKPLEGKIVKYYNDNISNATARSKREFDNESRKLKKRLEKYL